MATEQSQRNPVEELAEQFLQRYRAGERPALTEYTERYPALASEIRELFPALVMLEEAGPVGRSAERPPSRSALEVIPERIGDYRILREIGRGGMGVVYEAAHETLGRHVALKVLPTHSAADPKSLGRFRREARSAARLHHTNIVPVFDVGERDGVHYLAMQFIPGQGLDEVLLELRRLRGRSGAPSLDVALTSEASRIAASLTGQLASEPMAGTNGEPDEVLPGAAKADAAQAIAVGGMPEPSLPAQPGRDKSSSVLNEQSEFSAKSDFRYFRSVARIGLQVAEALAYAHGQRVLHRDIKPSNLLLDHRGTAWVTDFGLAKEEGDDVTAAGDIVGTLRYMAPERFRGKSGPGSDIYSLGLTLYELLALRPAFEEPDRARLLRRVAHDEPPPPSEIDDRVPRDLETIVLKAMAKDAAHRYTTAEELAEDLRRFLSDRPIRARRVTQVEQLWRWCRRNPLAASLATSIAVLLAVIGAGALLANLLRVDRDRAMSSERRARQAESDAKGLLTRALAAEREVQVRAHLASATAHRRSNLAERRFRGLEEVRRALALDPPEELRRGLRNEAIAAMILPDLRGGEKTESRQPGTARICYSPTLDLRARVDTDGRVILMGDQGERTIAQIPDLTPAMKVAFSPTGDSLILSSDPYGGVLQGWLVMAGPGGDASRIGHPILPAPMTNATEFDFRPDGTRLAVGRLDGSVHLVDVATGQTTSTISLGGTPIFLTFHPDGRRLAVCENGHPNRVQIWDVDENRRVQELTLANGEVTALAWHPEGDRLAVATLGAINRSEIWDVAGNRQVAVMEGHAQTITALTFDVTGHLLCSWSWDGSMRVWDAGTARQVVPWTRVSVLPNGRRWVGYDDHGVEIQPFELVPGFGYETFVSLPHDDPEGYQSIALSGDGRILAVLMSRSLRLWDLRTGRELCSLPLEWAWTAWFTPHDADLVTSGLDGVIRWPLRWSERRDEGGSGAEERLLEQVGPPQRIVGSAPTLRATVHTDQTTAAVVTEDSSHIQLIDVAENRAIRMIGPHPSVSYVSLDPAASRLATSGWHSDVVAVWDVATGNCIHELKLGAPTLVEFSRDGRSLVTSRANEYEFRDVGTWQVQKRLVREGCPFPSPAAFSPDGRIVALQLSPVTIHLLDSQTGEELARLEDPNEDRPSEFAFTPDGGKLVVLCGYSGTIHVWNLREIRSELARLGLDWDPVDRTSEKSAAPAAEFETTAASVPVADLGDLLVWQGPRRAGEHFRRARAAQLAENWKESIAQYERAITLFRDDPRPHNNLAWILATSPDLQLRNVSRARELADRAVQLAPQNPSYHNTLGVALYRVGEWSAAIEALDRSDELSKQKWFAHNAHFRAMAHWQLRNPEAARESYDRALEWTRQNASSISPADHEELRRFQAEAEEMCQFRPNPGP